MIDIDAIKKEATKQINDEKTAKAKTALVAQMRVVERAREVLRGEEMKLKDIEAQILDGSL